MAEIFSYGFLENNKNSRSMMRFVASPEILPCALSVSMRRAMSEVPKRVGNECLSSVWTSSFRISFFLRTSRFSWTRERLVMVSRYERMMLFSRFPTPQYLNRDKVLPTQSYMFCLFLFPLVSGLKVTAPSTPLRNAYACAILYRHETDGPYMKEVLPKIAFINNARTYKLLANEKRLEILNNIKYEEKRVEELVKILGVSKANVSQHLALLRHAGIVETRREGQNIYYKIIDPEIIKPCVILYNLWVSNTRAKMSFSSREQKVK